MRDAYELWKAAKARYELSSPIVLIRLENLDYVTFDEDAEQLVARCVGSDYVPQVLGDPCEECCREFRVTDRHVGKVVAVLLRNLVNVFAFDVCAQEVTI